MTKKTIKLITLLFGVAFIFGADYAQGQSSPDAIAIRVIPNTNHYSARVWYQEQNFTGSPQSMMVDGYAAVRDGRTLYVNVGNAEGGNLYTNIYLISYNQEAETVTQDIFGQILSHWKFNTNLIVTGFCRNNPSVRCLKDEECPISDYCDSAKARVIRDTRRLSDLADMQVTLNQFNLDNGHFPSLSAGSYLPNRSLSVWPSWDDALRDELGTNMLLGPINKIGNCPGYDEDTCWDEVNKSFPTTLPNLPTNSLAYIYLSDPGGNIGTVCGVFESGYAISGVPVCAVDVCLDFDDDGYGSPGSALCTDGPETDCNDTDPDVQFGGPEDCTNFLDDDCDSFVDCFDSDCFGSPACTGFLCVPNGCGGGCPSFCTVLEDPDCPPCTSGNGCCDEGCSFAQDSDCPITCTPNGCDNGCLGCTPAEDGDCAGCASDIFGCCPTGCTRSLGDMDCPEICTDADGDGQNAYDALLCPSGSDCDDSNGNIYTGAFEDCDGLDNNCSDPDHTDGINPVDIDEGWSDENCDWVCVTSGYDWSGNGLPALNCCGNDPLEASPYQAFENVPIDLCSDLNDNDCDG
ncbi:putative metal-binding motif-containing protein, partial [Candidatus Parcubacteria bacterium]|nr:putative metal-binding motif-containing protein [Candidatus Parcubacteria bacterium]